MHHFFEGLLSVFSIFSISVHHLFNMRHRGPLPSVSSALAQSLQHLSPPFFHINAVAITPVFYEIKVPEPLYLSHFLFFIPKFTSLLFRNLLCYIPNPCVTLFRNSSVAFSDMTCWEFRAWTAPHSEMSGRKFPTPAEANSDCRYTPFRNGDRLRSDRFLLFIPKRSMA